MLLWKCRSSPWLGLHEKVLGSKTAFRLQDGYIENSESRQGQHFVKRKGVYFMKMYTDQMVEKDLSAEFYVARPRNP